MLKWTVNCNLFITQCMPIFYSVIGALHWTQILVATSNNGIEKLFFFSNTSNDTFEFSLKIRIYTPDEIVKFIDFQFKTISNCKKLIQTIFPRPKFLRALKVV